MYLSTKHIVSQIAHTRIKINLPQELDLVQGLVKVVLVVLDNLEANDVARVEVHRLHSLGERRAAEVLGQFVPPRDDVADAHGEILLLLEPRAVQPVDDWQTKRQIRFIRAALVVVREAHFVPSSVRIGVHDVLLLVADVTVRPGRVQRTPRVDTLHLRLNLGVE